MLDFVNAIISCAFVAGFVYAFYRGATARRDERSGWLALMLGIFLIGNVLFGLIRLIR